MSNLFMDMHRRRWHSHQTPPPPPSLTSTTSSSSTQHPNDHRFSHNNNDGAAAPNINYYNEDEEEEEEGEINDADDADDDDVFANVLSLKLRKPKHWKWELSTSKSCSNIALPRILLYDHKGELLADAQGEDERIYKQDEYEKPKRDKSKKRSYRQQQPTTPYHQRSSTTNLTHSICKALEKEFNGLQIQEATPSLSPEPYSRTPSISISNRSHRSRKPVELETTDLPDYTLSRRSSSLRGVRFNVANDHHLIESQIPEFLPTPPSTTTTTTTPTSSSSGPREKRKYRRSQSSGRSSAHSESILERFSYQKGRFSSPEYAEEHQVQHSPRYFLRTSKAGTLVVQEDSFSQHTMRRRRRPYKNHSSESLQKSSHSSTSPTQQQSVKNSPTPSEAKCKKQHQHQQQQQPIRRHLSDGNILLNKQLSSSEEDVELAVGQKPLMDNVNSRHLRKHALARNQNKDLNYTLDVQQNGKVR